MKPKLIERAWCAGCNMDTASVSEYHPYAVCELYKTLKNRGSVVGNIKAVIEYGMRAERAGLSVDEAFANFNKVPHERAEEGE